ncbi:hypothetical protein F5882DRAFT_468877 [Hyaloscypha sp. PMI_1271]|nr:hypothetical protein F5882DRAFT_468877 [Hyaloscypha sp. PMI_1271]
MFGKLKNKFLVDQALDPLKAWVKDSPNKQLLMIGNILRPYEFPLVSKEGWVIIYAITCEHNLFKGCYNEWKATSFDTSFAALPGTSFKNNEHDNDLLKMYLLHVDWKDSKLNRPKAGDIVNVRIPFDVPDCPEYKGEDAKRACAQDFNDDGTFREDLDDDEQEAAEVRREISAEARAEEELRQLQTWMGSVQTDFRFRGPEGCERRVDTEIPGHKTNFRNLKRLRIEFAKVPKFSVSIEPSYSDRTYRDLVRNLNSFFQLQSDEFVAPANIHLAEYFLAFDDTLEYPITNFFNDYAPKD